MYRQLRWLRALALEHSCSFYSAPAKIQLRIFSKAPRAIESVLEKKHQLRVGVRLSIMPKRFAIRYHVRLDENPVLSELGHTRDLVLGQQSPVDSDVEEVLTLVMQQGLVLYGLEPERVRLRRQLAELQLAPLLVCSALGCDAGLLEALHCCRPIILK